jgi:NAD(P)-dependent dehydrogenase (short-subunit alcohol dehydrogenase family)
MHQTEKLRLRSHTMLLKDKVAIITGAGQGIGREYARRFRNEGAKLVIADINYENAKVVEQELIGTGGEALAIKVDISKGEDCQMMADKTVERFGKIDILLNNAAIYAGLTMQPWDLISEDEWDLVYRVNVKGQWLATKAVVPYMKRLGKGKIINTSSSTVLMGIPLLLAYATSKSAIIGMTRCLANELGEYGICVNTISPGLTMTSASTEMPGQPPGLAEFAASMCALKRNQQPEDLMGTALFLASDLSDFITGQLINVDGGGAMH